MLVIISGGRNFTDYDTLVAAIYVSGFDVGHIISGGARGVDALAIKYAQNNNIPYTIQKADWQRYGRAAGPIRNKQMLTKGDALIALWDGKSAGTGNMIKQARAANMFMIYVHDIK